MGGALSRSKVSDGSVGDDKKYFTQQVLYATDRDGDPFNCKRQGKGLRYGRAEVLIPKCREPGHEAAQRVPVGLFQDKNDPQYYVTVQTPTTEFHGSAAEALAPSAAASSSGSAAAECGAAAADTPARRQFLAEVREEVRASALKELVVHIHGYNVDHRAALLSAGKFTFDASQDYTLIDLPGRWKTTVFSEGERSRAFYRQGQRAAVELDWTSLGDPVLYGFIPFFVDDRERAEKAGEKLGLLLFELAKVIVQLRKDDHECEDAQMHIVCHSMGNYVFYHAVKTMATKSAANWPKAWCGVDSSWRSSIMPWLKVAGNPRCWFKDRDDGENENELFTKDCMLMHPDHGGVLLEATKTIIHAAADVARCDLRNTLKRLKDASVRFGDADDRPRKAADSAPSGGEQHTADTGLAPDQDKASRPAAAAIASVDSGLQMQPSVRTLGEKYRRMPNITVYVSRRDKALMISSWLRRLFGHSNKNGRAGFFARKELGPLTFEGHLFHPFLHHDVITVDATGFALDMFGHGYYAEHRQVLTDVSEALTGAVHVYDQLKDNVLLQADMGATGPQRVRVRTAISLSRDGELWKCRECNKEVADDETTWMYRVMTEQEQQVKQLSVLRMRNDPLVQQALQARKEQAARQAARRTR